MDDPDEAAAGDAAEVDAVLVAAAAMDELDWVPAADDDDDRAIDDVLATAPTPGTLGVYA